MADRMLSQQRIDEPVFALSTLEMVVLGACLFSQSLGEFDQGFGLFLGEAHPNPFSRENARFAHPSSLRLCRVRCYSTAPGRKRGICDRRTHFAAPVDPHPDTPRPVDACKICGHGGKFSGISFPNCANDLNQESRRIVKSAFRIRGNCQC
jgi:hypothetical protein